MGGAEGTLQRWLSAPTEHRLCLQLTGCTSDIVFVLRMECRGFDCPRSLLSTSLGLCTEKEEEACKSSVPSVVLKGWQQNEDRLGVSLSHHSGEQTPELCLTFFPPAHPLDPSSSELFPGSLR